MDKIRFRICSITILVGVFIIAESCFSYYRNYKDYTDKVKAEVVEVERVYDTLNKRKYKPTYQYEYDGELYTTQASYVVRHHRYKIGDEVVLKINPSEPSQVVDKYILWHNYYNNRFCGAGILIVGLFLVRILYR